MNRKLFSMALLAGMTLFAACSNDETSNNGDNGIADGTTLSGTVTEDVTLKSGNTYKLSGAYTVEEGATLNIEPGVKLIAVYDDNVDYILIKQGAKINAKGTADAPIIMTSEKKKPEPGAASTSADAPIPTLKAARAVRKSAVPNMAATMTKTTRVPCNTSAWSTPAMPSTRSTKPTASASTV